MAVLTVSVAVVCLAVIAAATVLHFRRAIQDLMALRKEAKSLLTLHWRARAAASPTAAINHYRKIGSGLVTFDQSNRITGFLIQLLGYRPREAAIALTSIANKWAAGPACSPDDEYRMIELTLFPEKRQIKKLQCFIEAFGL